MSPYKKKVSDNLILLVISLLVSYVLYIYVDGHRATKYDTGGICEVQDKCQEKKEEERREGK